MRRLYVQQKQMYPSEDTSAFKVTEGRPHVSTADVVLELFIEPTAILKGGG